MRPLSCLLFLFVFIIYCNGQPKLIKTQGSTQFDNIRCGLHDKAENSWFGTYGRTDNAFEEDDVYRYDGKIITHLITNEGICSNSIRGLSKTKPGKIKYKSK